MMSMRVPKPDPNQDELALSSVRGHTVFPGRDTLYVHEVARVLNITEQHVLDLIQENADTDGKSGIKGVNIASGLLSAKNPNGNKTSRQYWRIPVSAYDEFISRRQS